MEENLSNQPDTYDTIPDTKLHTDVEKALANISIPVDTDLIAYIIRNGVVYLTHVMDNEEQRAIIIRQIRAVPGIRDVSVAPDTASAIEVNNVNELGIIPDNAALNYAAQRGDLSRGGPWKTDASQDEPDTETDDTGRALQPSTTDSPNYTDVFEAHRSQQTDLENVNPDVVGLYNSDLDTIGAHGYYKGADVSAMELEGDFTDDVGTTDPEVAVQERMTYFPATDPVIISDPDSPSGFIEVGGVAPITDTPAQMLGNDGDVAERVRYELRRNAITMDSNIRVSVRNGIVTLRGRVTSIEEVEEAEAVASDVEGVLEVNEQLEIVT